MHSDPSDSTLVSLPAATEPDSAVRFAARTHPGRRPGQNEDAIGWNTTRAVWFVADGMGGYSNGDVASRVVYETLVAMRSPTLETAILDSHRAIVEEATRLGAVNNMGSTVVAAQLKGTSAEIVWVGDSRAYLWRKSKLQLVTRDHSLLEALRQQGQLSEGQMRDHPNRNLVTQTLGFGDPQPSVVRVDLEQADWLVLCSDGLNDELDDQQIAAILQGKQHLTEAADALIEGALASGGRDNVSVVIVEARAGISPQTASRFAAWIPLLLGVGAALACTALWWLAR